VTVPAGKTGTESKVVGVPAKPPACDIELAFDTTGSMADALSQAGSQAEQIVKDVQSSVPDCQFAVVGFKDAPPASFGDPYEYKLFQAMTSSGAAVATAISGLSASGGGDAPEAYNNVFHDSYPDGPPTGWRTGSRKFVIVFGDAQPHGDLASQGFAGCSNVSADPNVPPLSTTTELAAMKTNQRTLFMILFHPSAASTTLQCYQSLAAAAYAGGQGVVAGGNLASQIVGLVNAAFATVQSVNLQAVSCGPSPASPSWISFTPSSLSNVPAPSNQNVTVNIAVPDGTASGSYTCTIKAFADGVDIGTQTLTIVVPPGTICVSKYYDRDGNGKQGPREPTLSNWSFNINTSPATTTVLSGKCVDVPAGTYTVSEVNQPGWVATDPPSGSQSVTVSSGQTIKVSFGNTKAGRVCVIKYWDKNGNGIKQPGEPLLGGWTFTVTTSPLTQLVSAKRPCVSVRPGTYTVTENQQLGWIPTAPASGGLTVTVGPGQSRTLVFGNYKPLLDHFECYWATPHSFANRLVGVRDQFNVSAFPRKLAVTRQGLDTLCNPASKNRESVPNQFSHLFCYPVAKGTPFRAKTVLITNQFGQDLLRIVRPRELCLPTSKNLRRSAKFRPIPNIAHYLCYDVRAQRRRYPAVTLSDEFGFRKATVLAPDRLCAPVQKFVPGQKPTAVIDPLDHLLCYSIRTRFAPRAAYIRNQFEIRALKAIRGRWLCVPSTKLVLRSGPVVCRPKPKTKVVMAGKKDEFDTTDGTEWATPPAMFDQTTVNTNFLQKFDLRSLMNRMCSVSIEFRVKALGDFSDNDAVTLSSGSNTSTQVWSQYFGKQNGFPIVHVPINNYPTAWGFAGPKTSTPGGSNPPPLLSGTWSAGKAQTFAWTFDENGGLPAGYPSGNTGGPMFNAFNLTGMLNVYVEDDTAVDYIKLTIRY